MDALIQFIGAPVNALTVIMVIGLIIVQLADKGLLKIGKWGGQKEEQTPQWAKRLDAYFNHDTTSHHVETQRLLNELIQQGGRNQEGMSEIRDYIRDSSKVLERIDREGVRCKPQ
jgi:hypothetical protein